jgi:hypothetical protein
MLGRRAHDMAVARLPGHISRLQALVMRREVWKDTISIADPPWVEGRFVDEEAQSFWLAIPAEFQSIARAERFAGNPITHILRNQTRDLVLLQFQGPPLTEPPTHASIRVHTRHEHGNYCYDDTFCTY